MKVVPMQKITGFILLLLFQLIAGQQLLAQPATDTSTLQTKTAHHQAGTVEQKDVIDILQQVVRHKEKIESRKVHKKVIVSVVPAAGYSLSSGFAGVLSGNAAFYASADKDQNISAVNSGISFSQYNQFTFNITSNLWAKKNKYNFVGDWRYFIYPQKTYGLGSLTRNDEANLVDYKYLRIYETALQQIAADFFVGAGYNLDYHYNIAEAGNQDSSESDFRKYGQPNQSISSGLALNLLYDTRRNSINPPKGSYANIIYRNNTKWLGSDSDWQSLELDLRKYIKLSPHSNNVLAFWSLIWLTLNGNPPYLDLPSTGWDTQGNSGRGYIQGRFRGKNMLYFESEYRFGITRNGLIGGVVFTNAETFSEWPGSNYEKILPAAGAGIRVKFNKHSNTNVCLDYGFGTNGSRGFFVNLGEVF